jgi:hypothetical protein
MFNFLATIAEYFLDLNQAAVQVMLRAGAISMAEIAKRVSVGSTTLYEELPAACGPHRTASHQHCVIELSTVDLARDKKKPGTGDSEGGIVGDALAGNPMYTLHKAKEEIDAVAKHATDIAAHALAMGIVSTPSWRTSRKKS